MEYAKLPALIEKSSSAVGFIISLGKRFIEEGIAGMDGDLLPELRRLLDGRAIPRVLPPYAIMLWFTFEVSKCYLNTKMAYLNPPVQKKRFVAYCVLSVLCRFNTSTELEQSIQSR